MTDRQEGGFFPSFIYSLGGFFSLAGDKGRLCAQAQGPGGAGGAGTLGDAGPAAPGALGGRFPPHTDGCFDSVERLT